MIFIHNQCLIWNETHNFASAIQLGKYFYASLVPEPEVERKALKTKHNEEKDEVR